MDKQVTRRNFLKQMGVTVGAAGLGAAGVGTAAYFAGPRLAHAAMKPKGNIPNKPIKMGHITFQTGPAETLGGPGLRGHVLAMEEINAEGGLLGQRKIETITADEAAGTDANVKELRRMNCRRILISSPVSSPAATPRH